MSRAAIWTPDGRLLYSTRGEGSSTPTKNKPNPSLFSKGRTGVSPLRLQRTSQTTAVAAMKAAGSATSSAASTLRTSSSSASTSRSSGSTSRSDAGGAVASAPPPPAAISAPETPTPMQKEKSATKSKRRGSSRKRTRPALTDRSPSVSSLRERTEMASLKERIKAADRVREELANSPPEERKPATSKIAALLGSAIAQAKAEKAARQRQKAAEEAEKASAWLEDWKRWVGRIDLADVVLEALHMPRDQGEDAAFDYMRKLSPERVQSLLVAASLGGLTEHVMRGIELLQDQAAPSGPALSEKFVQTGKFTMGYGNLSHFFNGLETLLGPPQMVKDPEHAGDATILMGMQVEHTLEKDCAELFTSSNGVTTTSQVEWDFAVRPLERVYFLDGAESRGPSREEGTAGEGELGHKTRADGGEGEEKEAWPEREGFRTAHPEWCRSHKTLEELTELLEVKANSKLRAHGHAELIKEELIGGRLYTGPMYQKYNAVLRGFGDAPGSTFLADAARKLCRGNKYVTTIHAINSAVIKLSKLSKAGKVYRGVCYGLLPEQFWKGDESGVKGGVEFGFQSTTRERAQAVHYAKGGGWAKDGDAMTIMEMQMGMIDRGADLSWLSQYPHEKEVLLPPLTGIEALGSEVEGDMLVVHSKLSLNLSAQTLEQVLSRRRKMLMDMSKSIELEVREALPERLVAVAVAILKNALNYGPLSHTPEFYNNDDNFALVMNETLFLQRTLIGEVRTLNEAMEKPELVLRGWKARGPARVMLLAGWMLTRTSVIDVAIDLSQAQLTADDGRQLAELMRRLPKLTSIDVRGNESLGVVGARALTDWLTEDKASGTHKLRSLNGVGAGGNSRLDVRKLNIQPIELQVLCAELQTNIFAEGVSAGMGGKGGGGGVTSLNRRGHAGTGEWQPLIWAAKDNNLLVAAQLLANGTDVNLQEPLEDKSGSCYSALHWAALRGLKEMAEMLLKRGANRDMVDKHGNTPLALAEKKGNKELVKLLTPKVNTWDD